ncbi:hypothetical protein DMB66_55530 [Actinoplanes sp. ATCC 53533]|uniref:hypothetical protein n=1 Tax=Actinoplanes sp. ATCC 53533 TaxID=1288362 RepID=UPI000F79E143|nr:hypothetical protein [Actinoplanes sp. ATCC 53533]RSM41747.1 hypothetical protein DMB66_55530 [Actinoplanes sp. ATCC 53533]
MAEQGSTGPEEVAAARHASWFVPPPADPPVSGTASVSPAGPFSGTASVSPAGPFSGSARPVSPGRFSASAPVSGGASAGYPVAGRASAGFPIAGSAPLPALSRITLDEPAPGSAAPWAWSPGSAGQPTTVDLSSHLTPAGEQGRDEGDDGRGEEAEREEPGAHTTAFLNRPA